MAPAHTPRTLRAAALAAALASCAAGGDAPARVIAVGDLHADLPRAIEVLRLAGVTDAGGRWAAGSAVLVQTGDVTDRGPDSKEVIELLQKLEAEAAAEGGRVVALLGNHEIMNLRGDWRYVSPDDMADFGTESARRAAFAPEGDLGRWLRGRDFVAVVGDTLFAHGGVGADLAAQGVAGINAAARAALDGYGPDAILGPEGPTWYRGYLQDPEPAACAQATRALEALGARRMVMGHTTQEGGRIGVRCDGRILGIDTGISSLYGGHPAAIEIRSGDARALYPSGAEDLPDPP